MTGESAGALMVPIVVFTISIVVCGTYFIVSWLIKRSKDNEKDTSKLQIRGSNFQHKPKGSAPSKPLKKKAPLSKVVTGSSQHKFDHPHLLATLKGHTAPLTGGDFSSSGKQFITAAEDRTVLIWNTKDFANKNRKTSRGNIEFDHAQHICWSPDSKAFLIFKAVESAIEVYKVTKKQNDQTDIQKAFILSEYNRDVTVLALGVAINGKFMMTCDEKNQLILYDLKGKILEKIDTRHGDTYSAIISPCGRFIVTTGFTPDAKVWEIRYNKNGAYECSKRVFELKGHSSGIYNCSINCDSSKMVTISKDGTWRLFNTQVEFEKDQEPYFLVSGQYIKTDHRPFIAISPDGRTIAIASGPNLTFYSAINGDNLYSIDAIYFDYIKEIKFDPGSKYLLTIGDKHIRVFLNVAGYHTTIQDLERSKSSAKTVAMKERISTQILDAKTALKNIKANISR